MDSPPPLPVSPRPEKEKRDFPTFPLLPLESDQLAEFHLDYGGSLEFGEVEAVHELALRLFHAPAAAYDLYDAVYDVQGLEQTLEYMRSRTGLFEVEPGPAQYHLVAVADKVAYEVLEVEGARPAVHDGHVVHGEARLERAHLEELVQDDSRIGSLLEAYGYAYALAVGEVVVRMGDSLQCDGFHACKDTAF